MLLLRLELEQIGLEETKGRQGHQIPRYLMNVPANGSGDPAAVVASSAASDPRTQRRRAGPRSRSYPITPRLSCAAIAHPQFINKGVVAEWSNAID